MFGINKNGTKHKVGIIMPAFFPASRVMMENGESAQDIYDEQNTVEVLDLSDVLVMESGVSVSSSTIKKKGNKICIRIIGSGSITFAANGNLKIAAIKSAYRPFFRQTCGTTLNMNINGQIYGPATCNVYEDGSLVLSIGTANKVIGGSSYPWSGAAGCNISWTI